MRLGERLWRDGFRYAKCGVIVTELLPEAVQQPAQWSELDREQRERAWKTVDRLNATLGRGTVRILSAGQKDTALETPGGIPFCPGGLPDGMNCFGLTLAASDLRSV